MTPAGLEPAIPGSVGRCLIHWATGPDGSRQLFAVGCPGYMHGDRHNNPQTNTKEQHGVLSEHREILKGRREGALCIHAVCGKMIGVRQASGSTPNAGFGARRFIRRRGFTRAGRVKKNKQAHTSGPGHKSEMVVVLGVHGNWYGWGAHSNKLTF